MSALRPPAPTRAAEALLRLQRLIGNRAAVRHAPKGRMQRRLAVKDPEGKTRTEQEHVVHTAGALRNAFKGRESFVLSLDATETGREVYEQLRLYVRLEPWVEKMRASDADYGVIDVTDEQQLALFYYHLRRLMVAEGKLKLPGDERLTGTEKGERLTESVTSEEEAGKQAKEARSGKADLPSGTTSYPVALLGAGASAAYYLATAGRSLDPKATVIIGARQPWETERGSEGVINHPLNMIAPEYQGEEIIDPKTGLAPRSKFSELVEAILDPWDRKEAWIDSVQEHASGNYYEIKTDKGTFYARRVIVALGIGKHKTPDEVTGLDTAAKIGKKGDIPRLMDMDRFKRAVDDREFEPGIVSSIAVIGPNAAIDVMSTVLRSYPEMPVNPIYWITGSDIEKGTKKKIVKRPFFLKGTDNEYVEHRFEEVVAQQPTEPTKRVHSKGVITVVGHDYLSAAVGGNGVVVTYGERPARGSKDGPKVVDTLKADIVVYGLGPDVSGVAKTLGIKDLGKDVEPVYDVSQHFTYAKGLDSKDSLVGYLTGLKIADPNRKAELVEAVIGKISALQRPEDDQLPSRLPGVVGMRAKGSGKGKASMEIVGATAYRFAMESRVAYDYISKALARMRTEELEQVKATARIVTPKTSKFYEHVAEYLERLERYLTVAGKLSSDLEKQPEKAKEQEFWLSAAERSLEAVRRRLEMAVRQPEAAQHAKLAKQMKGAYALATTYQAQLAELYGNVVADKYGARASTAMGGVPGSLPQNVVLGDQLTAARSSIEALQTFVPPTATAGVNFITSDHTVIATHVAAKYGAIPPQLADYVTAKIVHERRHLPLDKAPLPRPEIEKNRYSGFSLKQQEEFQNGWNTKLDNVARVFAR